MYPLGLGSTTPHFDWLYFSVMIYLLQREISLTRGEDYIYLWVQAQIRS